jgi:hypothetical protein
MCCTNLHLIFEDPNLFFTKKKTVTVLSTFYSFSFNVICRCPVIAVDIRISSVNKGELKKLGFFFYSF